MVNQNVLKILNRIFILSLTVLFCILVYLAVNANFKNFCIIKLLTGHDCPGCGLTRAFSALTHLHFVEAYNHNHLIVVVAPIFIIIWVLLLRKSFS